MERYPLMVPKHLVQVSYRKARVSALHEELIMNNYQYRNTCFGGRDSSQKVDLLLILSIVVLIINFKFQVVAFPLQCCIALYAVFKGDVKYIPVAYLALQDASYFKFLNVETPIKFNVGIPLSVHNIFIIGTFFYVICKSLRQKYRKIDVAIMLLWMSTAIPALYIALRAKHDDMLSVWQTPLIWFMVPSLYYWGIIMGKTWDVSKEYFVKRMVLVFLVQMILQLMSQYSVGCAFQDTIIPICFCFALLSLPSNLMFKLIASLGATVAFAVMFLTRYLNMVKDVGYAEGMELVSTFTRLGVTVVGCCLCCLRGQILRAFPYLALVSCSIVFAYATIRANTKVQSNAIGSSGARTFAERFEFKLVGDRGHVWLDAIKTELFNPPLVFKRYRDIAVYYPELGKWGEKMPPHNQVLTLLCRSGWWMGLVMVLFLWRLHIGEFKAAVLIDNDTFTLRALLAPSAAIFVIVGLTGQHVFTQMWQCTSLASLTFPGILYGAVLERIHNGRLMVLR